MQNEQAMMDHATKVHHTVQRAEPGNFNNQWACNVCQRVFRSQTSLTRHMWANGSIRKIYYCKLCDTPFIRFWHLAQHFFGSKKHLNCQSSKTDGTTEGNQMEAKLKRLSASRENGSLERGCCFLRCSASFDTHKQLLDHVEQQHAVRRRIHISERKHHDYVCEVCQLGFSKEKNLLVHQNRFALKKGNICTFCGKGFKHPSGLEEHLLIEHSDAPPRFECDQCGKLFKKKSLIKLHMVTHQRNRGFACDQCDRQFHFRYQLNQHKRTVHATEPHHCPTCKVSYARHRTLQQHFKKNPNHKTAPSDQEERKENQEEKIK
uniref:C2H2-type domain-containing protein n=1 Tax=Anopheles albimanus TaxID=7167 RepID=A0A182F649_ANOAL